MFGNSKVLMNVQKSLMERQATTCHNNSKGPRGDYHESQLGSATPQQCKLDAEVKIEYIPLEQWLVKKVVLCDERLGIYPWGFLDLDKEQSFQNYYQLTSQQTNKNPLTCFSCLFALNSVAEWFTPATSAGQDSSSTFVCGVRGWKAFCLAWGFSKKRVAWLCTFFYQTMILSPLWWLWMPLILFVVSNPSAHPSEVKLLVAMYSFANILRSGDWLPATVTSLMVSLFPVAMYWRELKQQNHRYKLELSVDLAFVNLFGVAMSILCNASCQVHRRKEWHRRNRYQDPRLLSPEDDAANGVYWLSDSMSSELSGTATTDSAASSDAPFNFSAHATAARRQASMRPLEQRSVQREEALALSGINLREACSAKNMAVDERVQRWFKGQDT